MKIARSVAELQRENVLLELESIDRMYLNAYVPQLTSGVAGYLRGFLGNRFASTKSVAAKTEGFVRKILKFAERGKMPLVRFEKGVRELATGNCGHCLRSASAFVNVTSRKAK